MTQCRACGANAPDDARFCPTCGTPFGARGPAAPPSPPPQPSPWGTPTAEPAPAPAPWTLPAAARPLGVLLMSLWNLGAGALAVLMGFALLIAGPSLVADPDFRAQVERDMPPDFPGGYAAIAEAIPAVGALFLLMGLGMAAVGYGMWQAKPWAWTGMMALAGLWLLSSLLMLLSGVFFALLSAFLLWYFTRPGVKRWFGREQPPEQLLGYVPPPSS